MQKKTSIKSKMKPKILLCTKEIDLDILDSFKKFRSITLVDSLDEIKANSYKVLILINIPINLLIKEQVDKFETKLLILEELDSISLMNMHSLFDDVYIGDKRNALIKYFSNILRGIYD